MTKANVMALNVQPAPVQEAGKGMVKGAADGSSKGTFDEALGRLQQEAQKEMASAGRDDTSKDKDTGDGGSGREGVPQSPLAMVMTLPLQQLTAAEVQAEAPAVVVDFTDEAPVSGDLIKTVKEFEPVEEIPARNLRSMLPQSDEAAVKNKDFLAMLSGDLTSSQRAEARSRNNNWISDASRDEIRYRSMPEASEAGRAEVAYRTSEASKAEIPYRRMFETSEASSVEIPYRSMAEASEASRAEVSYRSMAEAFDAGRAEVPYKNMVEASEASSVEVPYGSMAEASEASRAGIPYRSMTEASEASSVEVPYRSMAEASEASSVEVPYRSMAEASEASSVEVPYRSMAEASDAGRVEAPYRGIAEVSEASRAEVPYSNKAGDSDASMVESPDVSQSEAAIRGTSDAWQESIPLTKNVSPAFIARENGRMQLVQQGAPVMGMDNSIRATEPPRNLWQLGQPLQETEPAEPLGMALRQAARPVRQEVEPEAAASVQQVKDGYVQVDAKADYVQADAKVGYVQAARPHFSAVAASEAVTPRNESWQAVLNDDIKVEAAEPQPLRVLRSQEGQGQMSFGQDRESNSSASQWVSASMLEAEEPSASVPSQAAGQQHVVPAVGFQQQLQDVADVGAVQTPQAAPETQTDYEVPRQIVEQARLIRSGGDTEMVIHLKPEHLGDLTLKISVTESGAVNASFHSDNAQVRTIIENSLVQLKQELSDQGLKVDSVEVFSGLPDGQLPQGQGQQAWQQGQQGRFAGERKPEDYAEEADDLAEAALTQGEESAANDGVDYRI